MYIIIDTNTEHSYVVKYTNAASNILGCSVSTIRRKKNRNSWRCKHFVVYNVTESVMTGLHKGRNLNSK